MVGFRVKTRLSLRDRTALRPLHAPDIRTERESRPEDSRNETASNFTSPACGVLTLTEGHGLIPR